MSEAPEDPSYLLWLQWPEKCFHIAPDDVAYLRKLLPKDVRVIVATGKAPFLRQLRFATHVITWHFEKAWYDLAPRLRFLATPAAGRELVCGDAPPGVTVHYGAFHGEVIAESVVGFMFAWARGFFAAKTAPMAWPRKWISGMCYTLAGTRAVILGYGHVGRAIGRKLETLGVAVTGVTSRPPTDLASQKAALKTADWLILALPATPATDDILDARLIAKLPRRCVVINVGRGNAIDEEALCEALRRKRLAGAYLDVIKGEPTPVRRKTKDAVIDPEGPILSNLVLMPHASAFMPQYLKLCFKELKDEGLI